MSNSLSQRLRRLAEIAERLEALEAARAASACVCAVEDATPIQEDPMYLTTWVTCPVHHKPLGVDSFTVVSWYWTMLQEDVSRKALAGKKHLLEDWQYPVTKTYDVISNLHKKRRNEIQGIRNRLEWLERELRELMQTEKQLSEEHY